jgi:hypothetical protein
MPATYTLITSTTLGSNTPSVTLSSIPGTYTDLVLKMALRDSRGLDTDAYLLQLNGNTTNIYAYTQLYNNSGTAIASSASTPTTSFQAQYATGDTAEANVFSNIELYFGNYTSSFQKSLFSYGTNAVNNTSNWTGMVAGLANITSAITSITIIPGFASNFLTGSSFYLYGIKNS